MLSGPTLTDMNIEELRLVTEFASLAPSVHNTQPWRFVASGHTIEVRADSERMLTTLDPNGRQLHISCGAAVELARLAIRSLGYAVTVRLGPRSDDRRLLATLTVGHREPCTPEESRLVEAAAHRYTDRGPYDDERVPVDVLDRVRDAAAARGCWLRVLDRPGERTTAASLLSVAEQVETEDVRYREELAEWTRPAPAPDGVPLQALPEWEGDERVSDMPLRDFRGDSRHPRPDGTTWPPHVERDTLLLLGSDTDDPVGWLRTGRSLMCLLLVLTHAGLVSQPLGPVTDVPTTRTRLRHELGLLGHPQLLLRVGHGHGRPVTHRRPVAEVLAAAG